MSDFEASFTFLLLCLGHLLLLQHVEDLLLVLRLDSNECGGFLPLSPLTKAHEVGVIILCC